MNIYRCKLLWAVGVLSAAPVFATGSAESVQAATETLNSVPPLEYLAKAGQTISQTQPAQRQAAAANLVAAVCRLSETAAPMMIAHLGRMVPEALPAMASAGAAAQPALAGQMVGAAVLIAPGQCDAIIQAALKASPQSIDSVAVAAVGSLRDERRAEVVLNAVASAVPSAKPAIDHAKASLLIDKRAITVAPVVAYAKAVQQASEKTAATKAVRATEGSAKTLASQLLISDSLVPAYRVETVGAPSADAPAPMPMAWTVNPGLGRFAPLPGTANLIKISDTTPTVTRIYEYATP